MLGPRNRDFKPKATTQKHLTSSLAGRTWAVKSALGQPRVERYLNVELPVAAHRERARAAPRGTELHEPRGDSRLLLEARNPLPDHGGVRGRQGEGHQRH